MATGHRHIEQMIETDGSEIRVRRAVLERIGRYEIARLRRRLAGHLALALGMLLACAGAVDYAVHSIAQSGLGSYSSLALSDSSYVFSHFGQFMLSVADSLPVTAGIVGSAVMLALIGSVRGLATDRTSLESYRAIHP